MSTLSHDAFARITVRDNQLVIGGHTTREAYALAGNQPCYIYDRALLGQRVSELRAALPARLHLHYAIKANPLPAVVSHMATLVDGLDVASVREMRVALACAGTISAANISFAGPAKQIAELREAVAAGITLNVESTLELERLIAIGAELNQKPRIAFRVNPDFELKTSGMKMAGGPKQFGIDAELLPEILQNLDTAKVDFQGFHIFAGSQNLKAEALIDAHNKTFALAAELASHAPVPLRHLNIGGGLGIPYFPGEKALELAPVAANLARLLDELPENLQNADIIMELGRYLVGEAGYYLCEITDKKVSRGQVFLLTNGGLHHHLSNSGNFGQVIRKNYPTVIGTCIDGVEKEVAEIVGPLCTPLDIVASKLELPKAEVGDIVVVLQSGAYGASASPQGFLSHPEVVELLI